jgi:hypothetical protein
MLSVKSAKSNEIRAALDLLKAFASLAFAVITIDAMHTQNDIAQVILGRGRLCDDRQGQHAHLAPAAEDAALGRRPLSIGREN